MIAMKYTVDFQLAFDFYRGFTATTHSNSFQVSIYYFITHMVSGAGADREEGTKKAHKNGEAMGLFGVRLTAKLGIFSYSQRCLMLMSF